MVYPVKLGTIDLLFLSKCAMLLVYRHMHKYNLKLIYLIFGNISVINLLVICFIGKYVDDQILYFQRNMRYNFPFVRLDRIFLFFITLCIMLSKFGKFIEIYLVTFT